MGPRKVDLLILLIRLVLVVLYVQARARRLLALTTTAAATNSSTSIAIAYGRTLEHIGYVFIVLSALPLSPPFSETNYSYGG